MAQGMTAATTRLRAMAGTDALRGMAGAGSPLATAVAGQSSATATPGLSAPATTSARRNLGQHPASRAALSKAAQDFEALTIGQLLQPMFDTVDTAHGPFGGGDAEAAWRPMLVNAIAKQIAANGGLGLAQPVLREMLRAQETHAGTARP